MLAHLFSRQTAPPSMPGPAGMMNVPGQVNQPYPGQMSPAMSQPQTVSCKNSLIQLGILQYNRKLVACVAALGGGGGGREDLSPLVLSLTCPPKFCMSVLFPCSINWCGWGWGGVGERGWEGVISAEVE